MHFGIPLSTSMESDDGTTGADPLKIYLRDLVQHRKKRGFNSAAAVEIERLQVALWEVLISFAPAREMVLRAHAAALESDGGGHDERGHERSDAERLRAADLDGVARVQVVRAVREAGAGRPEWAAYLRRVSEAERAATRARDVFIKANLGLVTGIARTYQNRGVALLDLIQEGNIGLMKGLDRFDHRRGFQVATYATQWIRQHILRAVADTGRTVRVPVHSQDRLPRMARARWDAMNKLGRDVTTEDVAKEMGVPAEVIERHRLMREVSLQTPVAARNSEEGDELESFLATEEEPVLNRLISGQIAAKVQEVAMRVLTPREYYVIMLRYGLDGEGERTLEEVGAQLDITRERVRQIERDALTQLVWKVDPSWLDESSGATP